jgi:hypothetical protein
VLPAALAGHAQIGFVLDQVVEAIKPGICRHADVRTKLELVGKRLLRGGWTIRRRVEWSPEIHRFKWQFRSRYPDRTRTGMSAFGGKRTYRSQVGRRRHVFPATNGVSGQLTSSRTKTLITKRSTP